MTLARASSMRALKSLSILGIPILQCSACRTPALLALQDIRAQCLPISAPASSSIDLARRYSSAPSSPAISYRIGASFSAKGRRFDAKKDIYGFNASRIAENPGDEPYTGRPISGQDAFFISSLADPSSDGSVAFGVADGVGGWADSGIDSADFSHGLCKTMARVAGKSEEVSQQAHGIGPRALLDAAYNSIVEEDEIAGGGSTACVAVGRKDGSLTVANLGDSGFIQLRPGTIQYQSAPQTHAFNTPYQLSIVPARTRMLARAFGGGPLSDLPSTANVSTHQTRPGDVFVFATDGVWDNLSPAEVLKSVQRQMIGWGAWVRNTTAEKKNTNKTSPTTQQQRQLDSLTREGGIPKQHENTLQTLLAVNIVGEAKAASLDEGRDGPFAREVQRHYPDEEFHGGKVDDICVVVAIAVAVEDGES